MDIRFVSSTFTLLFELSNDDSRRSIDLYCSLIRETINSSSNKIEFDNKSENFNDQINTSADIGNEQNVKNQDVNISENVKK